MHRPADVIPPLEDDPSSLYVLGLMHMRSGQLRYSVALFNRVLTLYPEHEGALRNLVRALLAANRPTETLAQADRALGTFPDEPELHYARGTALSAIGQHEQAWAALSRAVALDPGHAPSWLNLGNACADLGDLETAERHCRTALRIEPTMAEAQVSLAFMLTAQGHLAEAIAACETLLETRPDFVQAHWNLAVATLLAGDLPRGFAAYEWRKRHDRFRHDFINLPGPTWDGSNPSGRVILIHAEQGYGDTIQFARYIPLIAARGGCPVLLCDQPLIPLFRESLPGVPVLRRGAVLPSYDCWIDQMSLPRVFGTRLDSIPLAGGFLSADPLRTAAWNAVLPAGPRVGVAWAGNPLHSNDRRRSVPPSIFAPLLETPGIRFINLQIGSPARALPGLADLTPLLGDYAETAALVANLDLVVCVDTSVAHLAGALGKPAWVLLPHAPDWRWLLGRPDSPWYDSVRLFRQPVAGDWASVMQDVAVALQRFQRR